MKSLIHSIIAFVALGAIAVCMTVSVWACNLAWVVLLANWLVEWIFTDKATRRAILSGFGSNRLLQAFLALFLIQVIGLLWSANWDYGLDHVRKCFPLIAVPMVLLTRPVNDRRLWGNVLFCYVMGIVASCIVGLVRWFTIPDLPYRSIVPFLSHIRFSLNLCLAIALLLWQAWRGRRLWQRLVCGLLSVGFLSYLFLLQSYTGLIILMLLGVVTILSRRKSLPHRRLTLSALAGAVVLLAGVSAYFVWDYYHLKPLSQAPLASVTANGNPYQHTQDGFVEHGNYVNNYVCPIELEREWAKVSTMPLDSLTANGYCVRPALVRYLNALGFTKDSAGMAQLSPSDIAAIEKSVANPIYTKPLSVRRMYAVMLYEYESYRCYRAVNNFTMLQRFELWRNGFQVFLQHPLFGTGTGDAVDACHAQLEASSSPMAGTTKHAHNQYLTYLISFGLIGFGVIVCFFVRAFRGRGVARCYPLLALLTIFMLSCLTEDTLETLAGDMFFAFFASLFYSCTNTTPLPTASE